MISTPDNPIRPRPGGVSTSSTKITKKDTRISTETRQTLLPPRNRGFTSIPNQDVLEKLIERALAALKEGIYWDRGSILNILV